MKKIFLVIILVLLFCSNALATQEHTDPEGLYSHQIAHLFFMFALVVLIFQIKKISPLPKRWKYIGIAVFLFLLWNIDTFTVHWLREHITPDYFSGSAQTWTQKMDITTLKAKAFYVGKILDHFLSVGAIIAFTLGIKAFKEEMAEEK